MNCHKHLKYSLSFIILHAKKLMLSGLFIVVFNVTYNYIIDWLKIPTKIIIVSFVFTLINRIFDYYFVRLMWKVTTVSWDFVLLASIKFIIDYAVFS